MNRLQNIDSLQNNEFDLCVIGGGASGAGCALDAALRGLKVALIEGEDFAAETSSKSTKLIHGGVRYLEQAFKNLDFSQLRQVRHGLEERHILLRIAPHLARPLALVTPVFSWLEGWYFGMGLKLYGWFAAADDPLPPSRVLTKKEALERIPGLSNKLYGAVLYYDGQLNDARYCLALAHSAQEAGAVVANHLTLNQFSYNEKGVIAGATVQDNISGASFDIRARVFLNCTGPRADQIRRMANPDLEPRLRPSKGVHAVLPHNVLNSENALLIPKTPDGRVVFAIPFEGKTLLGTTDHPYADLEAEPVVEPEEIAFLCDTLQPYIEKKIDRNSVIAGFGGLRPLIAFPARHAAKDKKTKSMLRDHEVEYDPASGLFSLMGGKWTTYRLMASDAVDAVCKALGVSRKSATQQHLLVGADGFDPDGWKTLKDKYNLPDDVCIHLNQQYGAKADEVAGLFGENPDHASRLHPEYPYLNAEVIYAARSEMACTVRDVLARRLRLEILDWEATKSVIDAVATLLSKELNWPEMRQNNEKRTYFSLIEAFQRKAGIPFEMRHSRG